MQMTERTSAFIEDLWRRWGALLGEAREQRGLSKRGAAEAIGVSDGTWRIYEAGGRKHYGTWVLPNPQSEHLRTIERVFGVYIDTDHGEAWRTELPPDTSSQQPGAYSGDPSQLAGILADLNQTVGELRDEVRRLNQRRGDDEDKTQSVDDADGTP